MLWLTSLQAATENLRVMTFNLPQGNIEVTDGNGQNTWANRLRVIHEYLNGLQPDLLGLQEPNRAELCELLRGMPGYVMLGLSQDGDETKGYSPLLYRVERLTCLASGTYWLTETPEVQSKVEGSTHYRIATWGFFEDKQSGARFLCTNTHLSYNSARVKDQQITVLKTRMAELNKLYGKTLPHLLTGDFNMRDYENVDDSHAEACQGENYQKCLHLGLTMRDVWTSAKTKQHYSSGANYPYDRIDYIFCSSNITAKTAQWDNRETRDGFIMSDHDPLWADVSFTTSVDDNLRAAVSAAWLQIDSTYTFQPLTAFSPKLITSASQLSSDGMQSAHGAALAIDGRTDTYSHSLTDASAQNNPHFLQVELTRDVTDCCFVYYRRAESAAGNEDRWQDVMVTASDDGQQWDYVTEFHQFGGTALKAYTSGNIALHRPRRFLRFHVMRTPAMTLRKSNPQYSVSEFQLYESQRSSESPRTLSAEVDSLATELETLIAQAGDTSLSSSQQRTLVRNLQAATEALRTARLGTETAVRSITETNLSPVLFDLHGRSLPAARPGAKGIYIERTPGRPVRKVLIR